MKSLQETINSLQTTINSLQEIVNDLKNIAGNNYQDGVANLYGQLYRQNAQSLEAHNAQSLEAHRISQEAYLKMIK